MQAQQSGSTFIKQLAYLRVLCCAADAECSGVGVARDEQREVGVAQQRGVVAIEEGVEHVCAACGSRRCCSKANGAAQAGSVSAAQLAGAGQGLQGDAGFSLIMVNMVLLPPINTQLRSACACYHTDCCCCCCRLCMWPLTCCCQIMLLSKHCRRRQ